MGSFPRKTTKKLSNTMWDAPKGKKIQKTMCNRGLANDMGRCDRKSGHSGAHSNRWLRGYVREHGEQP